MMVSSVMDKKNTVVRIFLDKAVSKYNLKKYRTLYVEDYVYLVGKPEDFTMLQFELPVKISKPLDIKERCKLVKWAIKQ